jgi:predicted small metal-binding protein
MASPDSSIRPALKSPREGRAIEEDRDVRKLGCRELGGDCDYVAEGQTPEEVKQELLAHVERAHHERMARMTEDERDALDVRIDQVLRRG